ncbi:MAG TPA: ABC transporter ATP-binding protein [Candidatus Rifleibacterium sp.]|nr:ABC transporter ATP-binding protein [Candidatus Rifleibacterium sp.]HPT47678.1 ABC transporter ATP-binding protein [Candidatus Rifleibacterium sp.]
MLRVKNFSLQLKGTDGRLLPVLEDISLEVAPGTCLGIAGESGSGKSVLALSIAGLFPEGVVCGRSGQIELDGEQLAGAPDETLRKLRGQRIGFVFQEPMTAMNPLMTLYDQIGETVYAHQKGVSSEEVAAKVLRALTRAGFSQPEKFWNSYPHQLSGGMRQRAMIAMALVMDPDLIIADEPTTAIDAELQVQLLAELRQQIEAEKRTMIFISHDLGVLRAVSDFLAVFYCGCLIEKGPTAAILSGPAHPYTADLVSALPRLVKQRQLPVAIAGNLPPPDRKPSGCVYSDRCRQTRDECRKRRPPIVRQNGNRQVACFFPLNGSGVAP